MNKELKYLLEKYWEFDSFRQKQEEIIHAVLNNIDTLALLPTGGGKSICFQLPALVLEGICIVVSPLIALMNEQVNSLSKKGIKSVCINSSMNKREIDITLDNCIYGDIKLLYVSPERLKTKIFIERFKKMKVSFVAIDEAHCISQWGYDFRPAYLNISDLKDHNPSLHFIALTATATPKVALDIQEKLKFKKNHLIQKSFFRSNLSYNVIRTEDKFNNLEKLLDKDKESAIIYVRSRRRCHELVDYLNKRKFNSIYYHAGLSNKDRDQIQKNWLTSKVRIIVATNAFGMGIDKPDVRTVINFDLPESIESYFQEAGRAGRDEKSSNSTLLINEQDRMALEKRIFQSYPYLDLIQQLYQKFCNLHQIAIGSGEGQSYSLDYNLLKLDKVSPVQIHHAFRLMELSEHISILNNTHQASELLFTVNQYDLDLFQRKNSKFNTLIHLLLRSYAGLFDYYAKINERFIARKLNLNIEVIKKMLIQLNDLNIISYTHQNENSLVKILEPRKPAEQLTLSFQCYEQRKNNDLERMQSIINYAYNNDQCRNAVLLNYFGENFERDCEICDVCKNKSSIKDFTNNDVVATIIRNKLNTEPLEIKDLIGDFEALEHKKKVKSVLRKMMDANEIKMNAMNKIQLNKK